MRVLLAIALIANVWTASAQGTFQAINDYSPNGTTGFVNGTAGWSFETSAYISVTALGCFTNAINSQGPMEIGLWNSSGSLLASNLITSVSAVVGLTSYESITPVFLDPGQVYYMGAFSPGGTTTLDVYVNGSPGGPSFSPDIQLGAIQSDGPGFVFPSSAGGNGSIYVGANFQFQERVPEPSSLGLLALGAGMLGVWERRRRGR